jgi:hypothetical protein
MFNTMMVRNNGPYLLDSNYWESEMCRSEFVYFSSNAGAVRILLPNTKDLNAILTGKEVILSRGPWPQMGLVDAMEVMFEDNSESPFVFHTCIAQWDRLPAHNDIGRQFKCLIYTEGPKLQMELPLWYRIVPSLPYMKPRVTK